MAELIPKHVAASSVPTPASGYSALFFDSSNNNLLSVKDSGGTTIVMQSTGALGARRGLESSSTIIAGGVSAAAAAPLLFQRGHLGTLIALATAGTAPFAFRLNPTHYPAVTGMTRKINLAVTVIPNAVKAGLTWSFNIYPVATWGGASGTNPSVATIGSSLVAVSITDAETTANDDYTEENSATFPGSADAYVMTVDTGGSTTAANSRTALFVERYVTYV